MSEIVIGQKAAMSKTITESDVYSFAGLSGDFNPAHVNEVYAQGTMFKTRIAHGMLSAGLLSAVIGMQLPGPGTIYLGQTLQFRAPVKIGDTITACVSVKEIIREKSRAVLDTRCINQDGKEVIIGEAVVLYPQ